MQAHPLSNKARTSHKIANVKVNLDASTICHMIPTLFLIPTEELVLLETQVHETRTANQRTSIDDSTSQQIIIGGT